MSNQVVQLTDDNNNNIYPVAGALMEGSVTTSTIENEAVTAAKIDIDDFVQAITNNMGEWEVFLSDTTSIVDYQYTVPATYHLAEIDIYIDASASQWTITINSSVLEYTTANARSTFSSVVKAGDIIKIKRASGSATAWHSGFIRKIL